MNSRIEQFAVATIVAISVITAAVLLNGLALDTSWQALRVVVTVWITSSVALWCSSEVWLWRCRTDRRRTARADRLPQARAVRR